MGGVIYENITAVGKNIWTATRNGWIYTTNPEEGYWRKEAQITLTLSADGNTITTHKHWSFTRMQTSTSASGAELTETVNYHGVAVTYIGNSKDKKIIAAKVTNTNAKVSAVVKISNGMQEWNTTLDPGVTWTVPVKSESLNVDILFTPATGSEDDVDVIDFIKKEIRDYLIMDEGLKSNFKPTAIGTRG